MPTRGAWIREKNPPASKRQREVDPTLALLPALQYFGCRRSLTAPAVLLPQNSRRRPDRYYSPEAGDERAAAGEYEDEDEEVMMTAPRRSQQSRGHGHQRLYETSAGGMRNTAVSARARDSAARARAGGRGMQMQMHESPVYHPKLLHNNNNNALPRIQHRAAEVRFRLGGGGGEGRYSDSNFNRRATTTAQVSRTMASAITPLAM